MPSFSSDLKKIIGLVKRKKSDSLVVLDSTGKVRPELVPLVKENFSAEVEYVFTHRKSVDILIDGKKYALALESFLAIKLV